MALAGRQSPGWWGVASRRPPRGLPHDDLRAKSCTTSAAGCVGTLGRHGSHGPGPRPAGTSCEDTPQGRGVRFDTEVITLAWDAQEHHPPFGFVDQQPRVPAGSGPGRGAGRGGRPLPGCPPGAGGSAGCDAGTLTLAYWPVCSATTFAPGSEGGQSDPPPGAVGQPGARLRGNYLIVISRTASQEAVPRVVVREARTACGPETGGQA